MYGFGNAYNMILPRIGGFNPLDIDGLQLYLNKDLGVNTKIAADFDGVNQHLSSASADFQKTNTNFSFGCWFKRDSTTGSANVMAKWSGGGTDRRSYDFQLSTSGVIRLYKSEDGISSDLVVSSQTYSAGTWHFAVCVFDFTNSLFKMSIDGNPFDTGALGSSIYQNVVDDFLIGAYYNTGAISLPFDGNIDGAFFYDKALSLAEIQAIYNSGSGIAYNDVSNLIGQQYAIGQFFDGVDDAFNIDSVLPSLASTTKGEWELYVNPVDATPTSNEYILSFGDTDANTFISIQSRTDGKCKFNVVDTSVNIVSLETNAAVFTSGVWTKVNIVADGLSIKILIDDVEVAQTHTGSSTSDWIASIPALDNVRIGELDQNSLGGQGWLNGTVQNVKIWSDDTQTTLVANYPMNNVEGADQVDIENGFDATPIGLPISTVASVDNTTLVNQETDLVSLWELNETSGTRYDAHASNDLTDNNSVGYALGKIQEPTEVGELVSQWIDQSPNMFVFPQDTITRQPILGANSVNFDGVTDRLILPGSNLLNDFSGILFFSFYYDGSSAQTILSSADNSVDNKVIAFQVASNKVRLLSINGAVTDNITSLDNCVVGYNYAYIGSTGTSTFMTLNGVVQVPQVLAGTNQGTFFADISGRDNLVIGGVERLTPFVGANENNKLIYSNIIPSASEITKIDKFMSKP